MNVLYVTSEALPFIASGGLADVAGSLPRALQEISVNIRVVLPLYESIPDELRSELTFLKSITVPVAWRRQYCGIFYATLGGVTYYLLDNEYYFKRNPLYGHYDDGERFAFFARAALEIIPHIGFKPDIIHCNDWQTALVPVYYSTMYYPAKGYENIRTVFTVHNIQYQGIYGSEIIPEVIGIPPEKSYILEYRGCVNLLKGAIECADTVSTVSPTYAQEITDPWFSYGLDPILRERSFKIRGILNGIDTVGYNPETDTQIEKNFSSRNPEKKKENKTALQNCFSLDVNPELPMIDMVSRLVAHKGLDLVKAVLDELLSTSNVQLTVLGSGDYEYEKFFLEVAGRYPGRVGVRTGFIPSLARKIYAGCDMFLMPSKSEPCGLSQMVALRYGAIPIVRETGGLADSVSDSADGKGNGFTFKSYNAHDMLGAIRRALCGYEVRDGWQILVKRAMNCDNSWSRSADEYVKMYAELSER